MLMLAVSQWHPSQLQEDVAIFIEQNFCIYYNCQPLWSRDTCCWDATSIKDWPKVNNGVVQLFQGETSQEVRRRRTLEVQKRRRDNFLSIARNLVDGQAKQEGLWTPISFFNGQIDILSVCLNLTAITVIIYCKWCWRDEVKFVSPLFNQRHEFIYTKE